MKHRWLILIFLLKLFFLDSSQSLYAQSPRPDSVADNLVTIPWRQLLQDISEQEDIESDNWEDYEQELEDIAQHPINLNTATREDLERLPFLSASQVEELMDYRRRYGMMRSMGELAMIKNIGWVERQLLVHFAYVG